MSADAPAPGRMILDRDGAIAIVMISNVAKRNAISVAMWEQLLAILDEVDSDPSYRCLVITGEGDRSFASGADISEFDKTRATPATAKESAKPGRRARDRLRSLRVPVIAMINGYCIGGGFALALSADIRIASSSAKFAIPIGKLGGFYDLQSTYELMFYVGAEFLAHLLYTSSVVDAEAAQRAGVLTDIVAPDQLKPRTWEVAEAICANAPLSMQSTKVILNALRTVPSFSVTPEMQEVWDRCSASDDIKEGRRAFAEKRKPVFTGH